MSECTREEILKLIEEWGGPEPLDLSGKDLSGIDLSKEAIAAELEKRGITNVDDFPAWARARNNELRGANLLGVNLQKASLVRADLQGAFLWEADLREAQLPLANLQGACLGRAKLQEASLRDANLEEADFAVASLQGADFLGANLRGAKLRYAVLLGANLAVADLRGAHLTNANLQGANLTEAKLQGAKLMHADFQGASLGAANLQGADLRGANLQRAFLSGADLQGAGLQYSHLEKLDLFNAVGLEGAHFYNTFFDDTRIKRKQLGTAIGEELDKAYEWAKEAYLALKNNFAEIGRYDDASWAYRKERQMEKATKAPWRARGTRHYGGLLPLPAKVRTFWEDFGGLGIQPPAGYFSLPRWSPLVWWFWFKYTAKWLADCCIELLCNYGEGPVRVLFWMAVSFLGFAAYYWRISGVWLVESNGAARAATWFGHYLAYSAGAFTTTQFSQLQAADHRVRMVTAFQAIVGIFLAGLLGFVAGNRIRRS